MTTAAVIAHAVIVVALLAAYVALSLTGHDATAMLELLAGYLAGAGVGTVTKGTGGG